MQCWTTLRQAFPYEKHCMGEGAGRTCPKERLFSCEKRSMVEALHSARVSPIILARIVARDVRKRTGTRWVCAWICCLTLMPTSGVMTSRRPKLPIALCSTAGGGAGETTGRHGSRGLFPRGKMACRDMWELRGDSLGNESLMFLFLREMKINKVEERKLHCKD